jgi:hypothetical protein
MMKYESVILLQNVKFVCFYTFLMSVPNFIPEKARPIESPSSRALYEGQCFCHLYSLMSS